MPENVTKSSDQMQSLFVFGFKLKKIYFFYFQIILIYDVKNNFLKIKKIL
jgi:hypothetical protein